MVNRIQEIINRYNLTAAKLADQLEVPRSTISHILTGRNKPSLEFIQKVLQHFPDLNTDWLIKGIGRMSGKQQDLFSEIEIDVAKEDEKPNENSFLQKNNPPENPPEPPQVDVLSNDENLRGEKQGSDLSNPVENHLFKNKSVTDLKRQNIVRIITFYADNTFDEYFPSNRSD